MQQIEASSLHTLYYHGTFVTGFRFEIFRLPGKRRPDGYVIVPTVVKQINIS